MVTNEEFQNFTMHFEPRILYSRTTSIILSRTEYAWSQGVRSTVHLSQPAEHGNDWGGGRGRLAIQVCYTLYMVCHNIQIEPL